VIDSRIGYVGSQNIVDADLTNEELVARVTGPVVLELQAVFAADWFLETEEVLNISSLFPHHHPGAGIIAQVLPSGPDYTTAGVANLLVGLIHGARERVVITTPYFIPDEALLRALQAAVLRGVEVHLVVSRMVDQILVGYAQRSYYEELLEAGIQIHLYRSRLLHAKHLSIDGEITQIGSSNVDIRSFRLNAEVSLIFYDNNITARLRDEQERYFANSDLLTLSLWRDRFVGIKVCENLARMMSPLL
jgi:cardiolipin synthase